MENNRNVPQYYVIYNNSLQHIIFYESSDVQMCIRENVLILQGVV